MDNEEYTVISCMFCCACRYLCSLQLIWRKLWVHHLEAGNWGNSLCNSSMRSIQHTWIHPSMNFPGCTSSTGSIWEMRMDPIPGMRQWAPWTECQGKASHKGQLKETNSPGPCVFLLLEEREVPLKSHTRAQRTWRLQNRLYSVSWFQLRECANYRHIDIVVENNLRSHVSLSS